MPTEPNDPGSFDSTGIIADRYRIERKIGEGGMAEVFLAEDLRHRRKVAVKLLRSELSASLGAARFLREIQIAAQLHHPHILPLFDSGEWQGSLFYVMPYVEGQSLRTRLGGTLMPLGDTVRIIAEVVDALAYAHQQGVVHRDIKPDNVMLSARHALVADFGVAKAVSEAIEHQTLTTIGLAIGTPQYMAPEQAGAEPDVDHRADIYSVGAMAYELLTGRPPFVGSTPRQLLAAQMTATPVPISTLRPDLSPALEQVVMRCLAKEPGDRWQSADELFAQLTPIVAAAVTTSGETAPPARSRKRRAVWLAGGTAMLAAAGWAATALVYRDPEPPFTLGTQTHLTSDPGLEIHPALSPDGKLIAYVASFRGRMRVMVQPTSGGRAIPVFDDTTVRVQAFPRWSPDGQRIYFTAKRAAFVAPALGGTPTQVIPTDSAGIAMIAVSPDGKEIAYVRERGDSLMLRSIEGSSTRFLVNFRELHSCDYSPRTPFIACVSINSGGVFPGRNFGALGPNTIEVFPLGKGTPQGIGGTRANMSPVWTRDGRWLLFVSDRGGTRDIYAQRTGLDGSLIGEPKRLTTGMEAFSISLSADNRMLAYSRYSGTANIWTVPIPSAGPVSVSMAKPVTTGNQIVEQMRVSEDGKWVYYYSNLRGSPDIWRVPTAGGEPEQITSDPGNELAPAASPNGREVVFHSGSYPDARERDLFLKPLDGGALQHVTSLPGHEYRAAWSPDGRALAYNTFPERGVSIIRRDSAGRWGQPVLVAKEVFNSRYSPDGKWLLASRNRADNTQEILIFPTDGGTPRVVYFRHAGTRDPIPNGVKEWSQDSKTIYFKSSEPQSAIWSIGLNGGTPRLLVKFDDPNRTSRSDFFTNDGKNFFFTIDDHQSDIWLAELSGRNN